MKLARAAFGAILPCATGTALAQSLTPEQIRAALGRVDQDFIRQNAATGRDWPSYGLNHAENRFSPLRASPRRMSRSSASPGPTTSARSAACRRRLSWSAA
jgi:hypothetical protein